MLSLEQIFFKFPEHLRGVIHDKALYKSRFTFTFTFGILVLITPLVTPVSDRNLFVILVHILLLTSGIMKHVFAVKNENVPVVERYFHKVTCCSGLRCLSSSLTLGVVM